ncbi:MAG: response regulator transcription factor [Lachnospiraceae bacterium]|jgi:two-component system alkaline phosphatase synthesis response regulator PhoP
MIKILIVEDEKSISDLIKMSLLDEGYHCVCAYDGQEAADKIEKETFDLILLDVMLPRIGGYELMDYIRFYQTPVIFLTAKADVNDKVKGLRAGAEDYITKPFEVMELLARVERVLRRFHKAVKVIDFCDVRIDTESRIVTKQGTPVNLTAKEFDLLLYFARNKNKALYRTQIYAQVWGSDQLGDSRTVDLHVQRLRKKLSLENILVSVYKIGYRLEVQP